MDANGTNDGTHLQSAVTDDRRTATDDRTRTYCELGEAVDALERVTWSEVPTMTASEAAALHARLREARDAVADRTPPATTTATTATAGGREGER